MNLKRTHARIHLQEVTNMSVNTKDNYISYEIPKGATDYHDDHDNHKYYCIDDDRYEENDIYEQEHYDFETLGEFLEYIKFFNRFFADVDQLLEKAIMWANGDEKIVTERMNHMKRLMERRQWRLKE